MGSLLAASVQGGVVRPLLGMAVFAAGLSLPFFLLAIFPSYLKKLPRSGGWLARVKVVMGFVIIAAMLKYLSAIDLVLRWNVITRERFLAAWIVLFLMAGLYLLGFLRLEGIGKDDKLGLGRLFAGMLFVIFAITLVPGLNGGRLGELDAIVPPPEKSSETTGLVWLTNDLEGALAKARAENKKVLVNFTGYACTNCHWMKSNMFPKPEITSALKDFVLVDLYTDSTDAASLANQKLEETKFDTIAIPFYVVYDPGKSGAEPVVVATFPGLTRNVNEFVAFLTTQTKPVLASSSTTTGVFDGAPLNQLAGGTFDTAPLAGQVLVVNFWATWCVPCRQEIPSFNALRQKYADKHVAVLGISLDEDAAVVPPFMKANPFQYPVAMATDAAKSKFQVEQLPVTLVFDKNGKQLKRFEGFTKPEDIEAAVQAAL
jgi:thiol:disulfide interchange protein